MNRPLSQALQQDVRDSVRTRATLETSINVNAVAEAVRLRHLAENVALEDIAALVIATAGHMGRPMVFERDNDEYQNHIGAPHKANGFKYA